MSVGLQVALITLMVIGWAVLTAGWFMAELRCRKYIALLGEMQKYLGDARMAHANQADRTELILRLIEDLQKRLKS